MAKDIVEIVENTLNKHTLAGPENPVLLMVSGGSDSTGMAYAFADLAAAGKIGPLAMIHVNHHLRGDDSDLDEVFVTRLAKDLNIPLFVCNVFVEKIVEETGDNLEAVAHNERFKAAREALESLCQHFGVPFENGRIATAHTQNDRVEAFYMRSIVGTGPGGFRSMSYSTLNVIHPMLDVSRKDLRYFIDDKKEAGKATEDKFGNLWREDVTNEYTDQFRAFVRKEIVPRCEERNPGLIGTLNRTMQLIADEDDYMTSLANDLKEKTVQWLGKQHDCSNCPKEQICYKKARIINGYDPHKGCVIAPEFCAENIALQRRVLKDVIQLILGHSERVGNRAVEATLEGVKDGKPNSGFSTNIQGNIAVSANKEGIRIEPMDDYRERRNMFNDGEIPAQNPDYDHCGRCSTYGGNIAGDTECYDE